MEKDAPREWQNSGVLIESMTATDVLILAHHFSPESPDQQSGLFPWP